MKYSYFYNEKGDYTVVYKIDTEEEHYIAICKDAEKAHLIVTALNTYTLVSK